MVRRRPIQQGGVLVEAALSCIVLLLFVTGMVEIGRLVHSYVVLTQIANEAVRFGMRIPRLEEGKFKEIGQNKANSDKSQQNAKQNPVPTGHQLIHDRVKMLMVLQGQQTNLNNVAISTTYQSTGAADARENGAVVVQIEGKFQALLPGFDHLGLSVHHTGEYLY